jgi:RecA-family ATPase
MPWRKLGLDQGGVIYCALEGKHGITNRVLAIQQTLGLADDSPGALPLGIVTSSINLLGPTADAPLLIETIKAEAEAIERPMRLVVVDTLSRALAGENENASEDMGALVMNDDAVRNATGAHLLFVHHTGKDAAKGARGHSLLRAATDTKIELSRENDRPHHGQDHEAA